MTALRERLGQVFTPPAVADLALALALDGRKDVSLLDPSCGDGVFLARARAAGVPAAKITGIEIDPATATAARHAVPGVAVRTGDFFAEPPARFDVVVGNPPYVRQETLGATQKQRVRERVLADWPGCAWPARADLAASFVARGLAFLPPGGRLAFVLSTAMLDAGYGEALRALLPGRAFLRAVVAPARGERWFSDAAIHAAVVVLERSDGARPPPALFARLRGPTAEASIAGLADLARVAEVREVPGVEVERRSWASLLRAPDVWFDVAPTLVPLSEVAELWRGTTSGANQFFYMGRGEAAARGIDPRWLVPLYRSPRHASSPRLAADDLEHAAFVCDAELAELDAGTRAWIEASAAIARVPSLAARPRWWSLPVRPAQVFLSKAYDSRFVQGYSPVPLVADQRVYALTPRHGDAELLAAVLSGTLSMFAIESLGRASMGQGALELSVGDARGLPVVDPRGLDAGAVKAAFAPLSRRTVLPLEAELAQADRRALDELLWPKRLRERRAEIHAALATMVRNRTDSAKQNRAAVSHS